MNRLISGIFWFALGISLLSTSWYALHGTIYFHTDIARDFLLIEDIAINKKLTLIGPHSGGIEGVFHGPAWLYLNLPAFILGNGNPAVIGWFWVFLMMLSGVIVYFVAQKLSDKRTALMAVALYGLTTASSASNLFNPFGAVLLAPLFFYFFISYLKRSLFLHLIICLFLIGLIIQFQMAWGVPILLLMIPLLFHHFITHKKLSHIFSFAVLAIPLSTFIFFDVRHQFIQIKSVLAYLAHPKILQEVTLLQFLSGRIQEFGIGQIVLAIVLFIVILKKRKGNSSIGYILYFYFGYIFVTLLYKGTLWGYYTVPFTPLFCIALALILKQIRSKIQIGLFVVLVTPLMFINLKNIAAQNTSYFKNNSGLWKFYLSQAQTLYNDAEGEFGWYVYTADQYGYSAKYAMHYVGRRGTKKGYSYEKKKITYLIISPSTNKYTNERDWKKEKIKITRMPNKIFRFSDGLYVEKYVLSEDEQKVSSASDLIQDLTFR